jgi:hypothetical protein
MDYIGQHTIGSSQFNKFKEKNSSILDKNYICLTKWGKYQNSGPFINKIPKNVLWSIP